MSRVVNVLGMVLGTFCMMSPFTAVLGINIMIDNADGSALNYVVGSLITLAALYAGVFLSASLGAERARRNVATRFYQAMARDIDA